MKNFLKNKNGAVGLLSILLVIALVLIFTLTISLQSITSVKDAKIAADYNKIYYATEGGMRDARMQLKKESVLTKTFQALSLNTVTITRTASIGLTQIQATSTGATTAITRVLASGCQSDMTACTLEEQ